MYIKSEEIKKGNESYGGVDGGVDSEEGDLVDLGVEDDECHERRGRGGCCKGTTVGSG